MSADLDVLSNLNDVKELSHICRLCLKKDHLVWAFNDKLKVTENFQNVIYYTTGIEITLNDVISQSVCKKCLEACIRMYQFRIQSQKNDEALQAKLKELKGSKPVHPSIVEVKNAYPTLKFPPLEGNILPKVCMELDEVERYFKDKHLNIAVQLKHAFRALRSMEKVDKDKSNTLESSSGQIGKSNVSPISIKLKHSGSSYEIIPKNQEGVKRKLPEDDENGKPHFIKLLGLVPNDKQTLKDDKVRIGSSVKKTDSDKQVINKANKSNFVKVIIDKLTDRTCNNWLNSIKGNKIEQTLKDNKKRQLTETKAFSENDKIENETRKIVNVEPKTKKMKYNDTINQKSLEMNKNLKERDDGIKIPTEKRLKTATTKEDCDNNNKISKTNKTVINNDSKKMSKSLDEEENNVVKSKETALKSVDETLEPKETQLENTGGKKLKLPVDRSPEMLKTTITENYDNRNVENVTSEATQLIIMEELCKDVGNNIELIMETTPNIPHLVSDTKQMDNQPNAQLVVTNCNDVNKENFDGISQLQSKEMAIPTNGAEVNPQDPNEMSTSPVKLLVGKETRVHVCDECGTYVYRRRDLKKHQLQHRRCRFCGMKFKSIYYAEMHLRNQKCEQYGCLNKLLTVPLVKLDKCKEIREKYPDALSSLMTRSDDDAETIIVSSEEEILQPAVKLIGVKQSEVLNKDKISDEFVKKMIEIENKSKQCDKSVETEHRPTNDIICPLQDFSVKFKRLKTVLNTFKIPINISYGEPYVSLNYNQEVPEDPLLLWDEVEKVIDVTAPNDIQLNSSSADTLTKSTLSADTLTKSTSIQVNDENSNKANKAPTCETEPKRKELSTYRAKTKTVNEAPTLAVASKPNEHQLLTHSQHVVAPVTGRPQIIQTLSTQKSCDSITTFAPPFPPKVFRTYRSKHAAFKPNPVTTTQSVMSTAYNFQNAALTTANFQQSKLPTPTVTAKVYYPQPTVTSQTAPLTSVESQVEKLSNHSVNPNHHSKQSRPLLIAPRPAPFRHNLDTKPNCYQSVPISKQSQIHHIDTQAHVAKLLNNNLTTNATHIRPLPTPKESQTHQIARMLNQNTMLTTSSSHSQQVAINANQHAVATEKPLKRQVFIMKPVTTTSSQHETATNNSKLLEKNPLLTNYLSQSEDNVPPLIPIATDAATGFIRVKHLSELK